MKIVAMFTANIQKNLHSVNIKFTLDIINELITIY